MINKTYNLIYLGFAIPPEIDDLLTIIDPIPHIATKNFSYSIVRSLNSAFKNFSIISSLEISNFPTAKRIFFGTRCTHIIGINCLLIGFINLILIKHLTRFFNLLIFATPLLRASPNLVILIHGSHTPFMLFSVVHKFLFGTKILILLTDEHGQHVHVDGFLGKYLRRLDTALMAMILKFFDGFICLSELFIHRYGLSPAIVVPGVLSSDHCSTIKRANSRKKLNATFTVKYFGGLTNANGVGNLVMALKLLKNQDIRIIFYGLGPSVDDILHAAQNDARILYGGDLRNENLVAAMLDADLLINPRPVNTSYAQFSFPSKLLEYMATEVPILTTKIQSIPDEISDCFFYINGDNVVAITEALKLVMSIPRDELYLRGQLAGKKVRSLYSESVFGAKVLRLLD